MPKPPSRRSKQVFKQALALFDIEPRIFNYFDPDESHQVDMIEATDRPSPGYATYLTVTLNEYPNELDGQQIPVEIYGVVAGDHPGFGEAISTCAFNCIKDGWLIAPGVVHQNALAIYDGLAPNLPHIVFVPPMDFPELSAIDTDEGTVHALQAIPISHAEFEFLSASGFDALQDAFQQASVDYTDLGREPVI